MAQQNSLFFVRKKTTRNDSWYSWVDPPIEAHQNHEETDAKLSSLEDGSFSSPEKTSGGFSGSPFQKKLAFPGWNQNLWRFGEPMIFLEPRVGWWLPTSSPSWIFLGKKIPCYLDVPPGSWSDQGTHRINGLIISPTCKLRYIGIITYLGSMVNGSMG